MTIWELPDFIPAGEQREDVYQIGEIGVQIRSNHLPVLAWWAELFGYYRVANRAVEPQLTCAVYVVSEKEGEVFAAADEQCFHSEEGAIRCYAAADGVVYYYARDGGVWFSPLQGKVIGFLLTSAAVSKMTQFCQQLLLPVCLNLIRTQGLFLLHAAAAAYQNQGVVLIGHSGSGKTTGLLYLLQAGWRYLADDTIFLRACGQGVEALALPNPVRVTPQTRVIFPELGTGSAQATPNAHEKYRFSPKQLWNCQISPATLPSVLLFPQITSQPMTTLDPISNKEALLRCLNGQTLFGSDDIERRNFALLTGLVRHTRSYQLAFGANIETAGVGLAARIADFLPRSC